MRNRNHQELSKVLEGLGFDCFLPGSGIQRVYFEFLIRHRDPAFDTPRLIQLLQELGCRVSVPRYPLLHQQPFFAENHVASIGRYPAGVKLPDYSSVTLPRTEQENLRMIRLPNFCHADNGLIPQYAEAFRRAMQVM